MELWTVSIPPLVMLSFRFLVFSCWWSNMVVGAILWELSTKLASRHKELSFVTTSTGWSLNVEELCLSCVLVVNFKLSSDEVISSFYLYRFLLLFFKLSIAALTFTSKAEALFRVLSEIDGKVKSSSSSCSIVLLLAFQALFWWRLLAYSLYSCFNKLPCSFILSDMLPVMVLDYKKQFLDSFSLKYFSAGILLCLQGKSGFSSVHLRSWFQFWSLLALTSIEALKSRYRRFCRRFSTVISTYFIYFICYNMKTK